MKKLVLILTLLLTVSFTSAYNFSDINGGQMEDYESMINERTAAAPAFMSSLVGNQTINLVIESDDRNNTAGAKIEGLTLTELQDSRYENATIEIITDQDTVENISKSDAPIDAALREYNEGDIEYKAEGFWNKLKLSIVEPFLTG